MIKLLIYLLVFFCGCMFGFFVIALAQASSDRDYNLSQTEITPSDARRSKDKIIEYARRHDDCKICIFEKECNKFWKCCPVEWGNTDEISQH